MNDTGPSAGAGEALRTELADIASNTAHPLHAGYTRGDADVMRQIDEKYQQVYGAGQVAVGNEEVGISRDAADAAGETTLTGEDLIAHTEVNALLQSVFGDSYESEMRDMRIASAQLFGTGPDGHAALSLFADHVTSLGPQAEVAAVRFLAELGRLSTHEHSRRTAR
jgi:hypothetical protein